MSEFKLERFHCSPNETPDAVTSWLETLAGAGYEPVTAYAVSHPMSNQIIHYYLMRKGGLPSTEQREAALAELAGGNNKSKKR